MKRRRRITVRTRTIRSAGAVVLRREGDGLAALVVHRRRQDDWTLPKGRLRFREGSAAAARREVREEAAVEYGDGVRMLDVTWHDADGRKRTIGYWLLDRVAEHPFAPTGEVVEIAWLPAPEALARLTHARDRRALIRGIASYDAAFGRPAVA